MKLYKLRTARNSWTDEIGVLVDTGRDYHEPINSYIVAHDILEHTVEPHFDPFIDEFMALGATVAGRLTVGRIQSGIASDIFNMAVECYSSDRPLCVATSVSYVNDAGIMRDLERCVVHGLRDACDELELESYPVKPANIRSIVGWMSKGYNLFNKRFKDPGTVADYLFDEINRTVNSWFEYLECEGREATLHVDFTGMYCHITSTSEDYQS
ncbi:hypothetical protein UFOVP431_39 [uncultured Caudovirales phage]|uniref:Uncharacterized protein n=1 Tax=uncultured Caudovirales phage TaxID=2100421 RepID=A0A6J5MRP5_9CAUD|nr:hypothetical protein UFOVP431_39 [uncultured Caudovirales phage]